MMWRDGRDTYKSPVRGCVANPTGASSMAWLLGVASARKPSSPLPTYVPTEPSGTVAERGTTSCTTGGGRVTSRMPLLSPTSRAVPSMVTVMAWGVLRVALALLPSTPPATPGRPMKRDATPLLLIRRTTWFRESAMYRVGPGPHASPYGVLSVHASGSADSTYAELVLLVPITKRVRLVSGSHERTTLLLLSAHHSLPPDHVRTEGPLIGTPDPVLSFSPVVLALPNSGAMPLKGSLTQGPMNLSSLWMMFSEGKETYTSNSRLIVRPQGISPVVLAHIVRMRGYSCWIMRMRPALGSVIKIHVRLG
mmetsp:Transcript_5663/g.9874  ORF Transcript_5663/g.9874 Transcript_5663/m.9874 type:complete len:308 (+) Transcript_5663:391-1314(+)